MKACTKCLAIKSDGEFTVFPQRMSLSGACNECIRTDNAARNRLYRERNREAINARLRAKRAKKARG